MNIDFSAEPVFSLYTILLMISGVELLVFTFTAFRSYAVSTRIGSALGGLAALGYGGYLAFFFTGGSYHVILWVFALPVVLTVTGCIMISERIKAARAPKEAEPQV